MLTVLLPFLFILPVAKEAAFSDTVELSGWGVRLTLASLSSKCSSFEFVAILIKPK
jgi:hypothetical protein